MQRTVHRVSLIVNANSEQINRGWTKNLFNLLSFHASKEGTTVIQKSFSINCFNHCRLIDNILQSYISRDPIVNFFLGKHLDLRLIQDVLIFNDYFHKVTSKSQIIY